MRSRRWLVALSCAVCCLSAAIAGPGTAPTREDVRSAVEALRADPDLPGVHKEKKLQMVKSSSSTDAPASDSGGGFLRWFSGLLGWVSEAGRVFVWVAGALLVAVVTVSLRHWIQARAGSLPRRRAAALPSHVRDLDIRPESLPEHIGDAARDLWLRGEPRAALSLLYRGALSRLVHDHGVPVRAASTEGECVALVARQLPAGPSAFFGRLVGAWQVAVYGGRLPDVAQVMDLCAGFDTQLRTAPPPRMAS